MKTVLLAAGVGQRLGDLSGYRPKCLLEFDGVSLLHRHLNILRHFGLSEIIIVTGYQAGLIEQEAHANSSGLRVQFAHNPDYSKGSVISLLTGLEKFQTGTDVLLMDADVLYDYRIIERLCVTRHRDCFLLDRDFEPGEEPVKLCVRDGHLIEFRKTISPDLKFDFQGESVGFFRFSSDTARELIRSASGYLQRGEESQPYEECIRDLLLAEPDKFAFEDITGLHWIEIDFPEDVGKAKNDVLPHIRQVN